MKFIHIADVHLGAVPDSNMPWGADREKEIWTSFQNIITVCNEQKADLLLIAGDLFHRQPLVRELKEVNYIFSKLETAKVVMMAGNHDFIGARSYYQGFEWDSRVHMLMDDSLECVEFPELNTSVYGFSYHAKDIIRPLYDSVKSEKNGKIQILLAHGGDEKDVPINFKKLGDAGFDYVALGHIHKPEVMSSNMAYSGSLEPLDKNETGDRGYILGEVTAEGKRKTTIMFIPSSIRQYKRIDLLVTPDTTNGALLDQAAEVIKKNGKQHIYQFCIKGLRDETIHFDKQAFYQKVDYSKGNYSPWDNYPENNPMGNNYPGNNSLGNVLEVTDESVPDYDFDALFRENSDNMIGMFIKKIKESEKQDEVTKKALYYGIEALLGARDR